MTKSLASILIASIVVLGATAGQANAEKLGTLGQRKTTASFSDVLGGESHTVLNALSESFNFTIAEGYTATILLTDVGGWLSFDQATLEYKVKDVWTNFSTDTAKSNGLFESKAIGAGVYRLQFQFDATESKAEISRTFDGTITVAANKSITPPVPEPETYAMLLAGLGLMGAIARRRKAK